MVLEGTCVLCVDIKALSSLGTTGSFLTTFHSSLAEHHFLYSSSLPLMGLEVLGIPPSISIFPISQNFHLFHASLSIIPSVTYQQEMQMF